MKISFILGTRPEIIKVAPVVTELKKNSIDFEIINTGQHKDLLIPYWKLFNINSSIDLEIMSPNQSLSSLTTKAINQIQSYIDSCVVKPTIIVAQGDTTTVLATSIVCFYNKIKFCHLEAGLRSFDIQNPYPEEFNRKISSIVADIHLCPTIISKNNLLAEKVEESKIHVVGNTVIDSLNLILSQDTFSNKKWGNEVLNTINYENRTVLITCHRRENQGDNLITIINAIKNLAEEFQSINFIWSLHPNPNVKDVVSGSLLVNMKNVFLVEPLDYLDLLKLLAKSICVISDSGGIQEEAPSFKTPVIVLRDTTERPEGVLKGLAFLVGANKERILSKFTEIIKGNYDFDFAVNPYGDGLSSERIVKILLNSNTN